MAELSGRARAVAHICLCWAVDLITALLAELARAATCMRCVSSQDGVAFYAVVFSECMHGDSTCRMHCTSHKVQTCCKAHRQILAQEVCIPDVFTADWSVLL